MHGLGNPTKYLSSRPHLSLVNNNTKLITLSNGCTSINVEPAAGDDSAGLDIPRAGVWAENDCSSSDSAFSGDSEKPEGRCWCPPKGT